MPFYCENCHKLFRDRCDLKRHQNRKNPCATVDTSGVTFINNGNLSVNGNVNVNVTINIVNNEMLSPDIPELLVNYMRETLNLGGESFDYIRAVKWITELHNQICKDPQNHNIQFKNIKSMTAKILTEHGWITKHTSDLVDELFKIRSSQLIGLSNSINEYNPRVLKSPTVKRTMSHVSSFKSIGFNHQSTDTRRARAEFKVALLN